jgi:hypothetical protein
MRKNYLHPTHHVLLPLLWALLALSQTTFAQSIPDAQWARVGSTLAITTDGNIVTSANLPGTGIPLTTPVGLKKYDLQGNQVWQAGPLAGISYIAGKLPPGFCPCVGGVSVIDRIVRIDPAPDGGIHLLGNEWGGAGVRTSVDATGRQAGSSPSGGNFFLTTPDGGELYTSNFVEVLGNGQARTGISVTKTGNPSWTTRLPFLGAVEVSLLQANVAINTPDGGYLLAGFHRTVTNDTYTGWAAKLDGQGNVSWQKLFNNIPLNSFNGTNLIYGMLTVTDVVPTPDGSGYTLVGDSYAASSPLPRKATGLLEINLNGAYKSDRAKVIDYNPFTNAYLTAYTGSGGKKFYAVGNTAQSGRLDPQIRLIDRNDLSVVATRTFPGPGQSSLIDIATAGDGSLVFVTDNNQLVKLQPEATTPPQPPVGALTLTAPTYNCSTGAFTFNTTGGDGSPIEYMAPGITGWTTNPNQFVDEGSRTALDVQPFTLTARQNGITVTYIWDLRAYCNGTPPPPPVNPPTGGALTLTAPTYNCTTGAFTFNTSGGDVSTIEYMAPGITGWTTNPNQFVDEGSRTANDVQPFTLSARQNGVTVTYIWDLRAYCNGTPPPPPVTPPTVGDFALTAPTYNCSTGAFTFNTSGGNGSTIEYMAPGITGWTTNPNQFVDEGSRTANDVQPFTLTARQSGVTVTYVWNLKVACGRARTAALPEPGTQLRVRVLGNPVTTQTAEVEITGAEHQALQLNLVDLQGKVLHQRSIQQAEYTQRVSVPIGERSGVFLLNVSTSTQRQQVKLVKP